MRIWGYIVLVLGIIYLILFMMANSTGAHIKALPFLITLFLIYSGVMLIKSGKGILQTRTSANADTKFVSAFTEQIPMSRDVAKVIEQQCAKNYKIIKYLGVGSLIFFLLFGAIIGILDKNLQESIALTIVFGILGIFTALMTVGAFWLINRVPLKKDLSGTNYLRTKGPIELTPFMGGAILRLADRAFLINGKFAIPELIKINEGTVDYSCHAHVILAAWDRNGEMIFCAPGYNTDSIKPGTSHQK